MISEDLHLKNLYLKAKRRGMLELDLLIGGFADKYLQLLSYSDIKLFEEFLNLDDEFIYKCLMNKLVMPNKFTNLWLKIQEAYGGYSVKAPD